MENKRQSLFMQMHNGTRTGEGSFNVALQEIFYKADLPNQQKLVAAFPEFFGDEVPEFGIRKQTPVEPANRPIVLNIERLIGELRVDGCPVGGCQARIRTALEDTLTRALELARI